MTNEYFGSSVAFVLKIGSILAPACFVGGAPEANPQNVTNGGIAVVYQFGTQ